MNRRLNNQGRNGAPSNKRNNRNGGGQLRRKQQPTMAAAQKYAVAPSGLGITPPFDKKATAKNEFTNIVWSAKVVKQLRKSGFSVSGTVKCPKHLPFAIGNTSIAVANFTGFAFDLRGINDGTVDPQLSSIKLEFTIPASALVAPLPRSSEASMVTIIEQTGTLDISGRAVTTLATDGDAANESDA